MEVLCSNPFVKAGKAFGCGQCFPCRINRRRLWTHRILLESLCHPVSCFVTLTYSEKFMPTLISSSTGRAVGSLSPRDLSLWLKRLREEISPLRIRFYGVGEYGDKSFRPHYHVALFGFPGCVGDRTKRHFATGEVLWEQCCDRCQLVGRTWGKGIVDLGTINRQSAAYLAEYTVKKMTKFDDIRLDGRYPEFARMSRQNGGIGSSAMWDVASDMMRYYLDCRADVPSALKHGTKDLPLGRYLKARLREMIGKESGTPEEVIKLMEEEMRPLRDLAFNSSRPLKEVMIAAGEQGRRNMEARREIFKKRESL